jgi:PhnB protein
MQVQPYLFFDGRCEEAIEFYRSAAAAEVTTLVRFKDSPEPHPPAYHKAMVEAGVYVGGDRLERPSTATTVRPVGKAPTIA